MSESRRELLKQIGASVTMTASGTGLVSIANAQHVHQAAEEKAAGGVYRPKAFTGDEFKALGVLAELIVPGAGKAGAREFIDVLAGANDEMKRIYTGGLAWLDVQMKRRYGAVFADAKPADQIAMMDLIAYRKNLSPELAPGISFFEWCRGMVVDAYYTSKAGIDEIGFVGNGAMREFSVPAAAVEYAVKRSGLG